MNKQLAVLGKPIEHSKSPQIHAAAYKTLGLNWNYERHEVAAGQLASFISGLDENWLGLSVTMPLKYEAVRFAETHDEVVEATGIANTLLQTSTGWQSFNTDVFGISEALRRVPNLNPAAVTIVGSGATAASTIYAVSRLYPKARISLIARNSEQARDLNKRFPEASLRTHKWSSLSRQVRNSELVISTLPSRALDSAIGKMRKSLFTKPRGVLLDVAYEPWPSHAADWWLENELTVVSGIEMLIFQAIAQCRVFYGSDVNIVLPNERAVEFAMRHSLGLV